MIPTEKQLSTKSTTDSFDEIYTNYDLSVKETYNANTGYPFDYPTRWLNDPSMNKRIAIRRLDVTPSTHSITLVVNAIDEGKESENNYKLTQTIDITEYDNLVKVMNGMCNNFSYPAESGKTGGLRYEYDDKTNRLKLKFLDSSGIAVRFSIQEDLSSDIFGIADEQVKSFLRFLNQIESENNVQILKQYTTEKVFEQVWNRDRLYIHASFSTSRRHFIGKRGDFYQNLTLLYPPPTNETTFYIRFTTNGMQNILLRYCMFDIQLCFIVNYKKATIL